MAVILVIDVQILLGTGEARMIFLVVDITIFDYLMLRAVISILIIPILTFFAGESEVEVNCALVNIS